MTIVVNNPWTDRHLRYRESLRVRCYVVAPPEGLTSLTPFEVANALSACQQATARFEVRRFPFPLTRVDLQVRDEGLHLVVCFTAVDRREPMGEGEDREFEFRAQWSARDLLRAHDADKAAVEIARWISRMLETVVVHELRECVSLFGAPLEDPHGPPGP